MWQYAPAVNVLRLETVNLHVVSSISANFINMQHSLSSSSQRLLPVSASFPPPSLSVSALPLTLTSLYPSLPYLPPVPSLSLPPSTHSNLPVNMAEPETKLPIILPPSTLAAWDRYGLSCFGIWDGDLHFRNHWWLTVPKLRHECQQAWQISISKAQRFKGNRMTQDSV